MHSMICAGNGAKHKVEPSKYRASAYLHESGEELFIVMEFVDGPSVATLKHESLNRVVPWDQLKPLIQQLCQALDYAHAEKVIHRDLKPANMMLDSKGRLKLGHQVQNLEPVSMEERLTDLEIKNEIPNDVGALVMACLSKDPSDAP
jgi:serine/threonine protein kinase